MRREVWSRAPRGGQRSSHHSSSSMERWGGRIRVESPPRFRLGDCVARPPPFPLPPSGRGPFETPPHTRADALAVPATRSGPGAVGHPIPGLPTFRIRWRASTRGGTPPSSQSIGQPRTRVPKSCGATAGGVEGDSESAHPRVAPLEPWTPTRATASRVPQGPGRKCAPRTGNSGSWSGRPASHIRFWMANSTNYAPPAGESGVCVLSVTPLPRTAWPAARYALSRV